MFTYGRPTAVFDRWVKAPIAIDPSCRSFLMLPASAEYESRYGHRASLYGVDAAFIALQQSLPTLNGYSAWLPAGWDLCNPPHPDYGNAVTRWITEHQMSGVCILDLDARTMTPYRGPTPRF